MRRAPGCAPATIPEVPELPLRGFARPRLGIGDNVRVRLPPRHHWNDKGFSVFIEDDGRALFPSLDPGGSVLAICVGFLSFLAFRCGCGGSVVDLGAAAPARTPGRNPGKGVRIPGTGRAATAPRNPEAGEGCGPAVLGLACCAVPRSGPASTASWRKIHAPAGDCGWTRSPCRGGAAGSDANCRGGAARSRPGRGRGAVAAGCVARTALQAGGGGGEGRRGRRHTRCCGLQPRTVPAGGRPAPRAADLNRSLGATSSPHPGLIPGRHPGPPHPGPPPGLLSGLSSWTANLGRHPGRPLGCNARPSPWPAPWPSPRTALRQTRPSPQSLLRQRDFAAQC